MVGWWCPFSCGDSSAPVGHCSYDPLAVGSKIHNGWEAFGAGLLGGLEVLTCNAVCAQQKNYIDCCKQTACKWYSKGDELEGR